MGIPRTHSRLKPPGPHEGAWSSRIQGDQWVILSSWKVHLTTNLTHSLVLDLKVIAIRVNIVKIDVVCLIRACFALVSIERGLG